MTRWKLRLTERFSGKTRTVMVTADNRAAAEAAYKANWSRFNDLNGIERAATKPEIIEAILADMEAKQGPRENARKRYGCYLRGLRKNELEGILEARLGLNH